MKLENMKRIADARTKGEWRARGFEVFESESRLVVADCFSTKNGNENNNAKFIAMASNHWDKIMAVVKEWRENHHHHDCAACDATAKAIDELEKE